MPSHLPLKTTNWGEFRDIDERHPGGVQIALLTFQNSKPKDPLSREHQSISPRLSEAIKFRCELGSLYVLFILKELKNPSSKLSTSSSRHFNGLQYILKNKAVSFMCFD